MFRISDNVPVAIKHVARSKVIAWDTVNGYKVPQELKFLLDVQVILASDWLKSCIFVF